MSTEHEGDQAALEGGEYTTPENPGAEATDEERDAAYVGETPPANLRDHRPRKTKGHYVVLWQATGSEDWAEAGYVKAHGTAHAKRQAIADAEHGHQADLADAIADKGALIRAVPAASWPVTKPTRYKTTRKLEVG